MFAAGSKRNRPAIADAGLEQHGDAFVEPARQAVLEVPAVELVPALVAEGRERPLGADVVDDAGAVEVVGPGLDFAEDRRLIAGETVREVLPLPAIGEQVDLEGAGGLDGLGPVDRCSRGRPTRRSRGPCAASGAA